jgi:hypothetical protein
MNLRLAVLLVGVLFVACHSPRVDDPQRFLAQWAADGADLATMSRRYVEALDDSSPAAAAYRRVACATTAAAQPMLDALGERFGGTPEYRDLLRQIVAGPGQGEMRQIAATADRQSFASKDGTRIDFVRRGDAWAIDALAWIVDGADDPAAASRLVLAEMERVEADLPRYRSAMVAIAEQVRAGRFVEIADVAAAIKRCGAPGRPAP